MKFSFDSFIYGFALAGSHSLRSCIYGFALAGSHSLRSCIYGFALAGLGFARQMGERNTRRTNKNTKGTNKTWPRPFLCFLCSLLCLLCSVPDSVGQAIGPAFAAAHANLRGSATRPSTALAAAVNGD